MAGAVSGVGGTAILSALRNVLRGAGVVYETTPMQVVDRIDQAALFAGHPVAKRATAVAAHLAYGTGAGAAFGVLRRRTEDAGTELAVGAALGVLLWGAGWAGLLPVLGADRAPWNYRDARVLLPILDHASYGAVWGLVFLVLSREEG